MKYSKNIFANLKKFEEEYVLINGDDVFFLEGIGAFIWNQIDESKDEVDLLQSILEEYEISEKKAEKDLKKLLRDFKKNNLINEI